MAGLLRLSFIIVSMIGLAALAASPSGNSESCSTHLTISEVPSLDGLLQALSAADAELSTLGLQSLKEAGADGPSLNQRIVHGEAASAAIFERLAELKEEDLTGKESVSAEIKALKATIAEIKDLIGQSSVRSRRPDPTVPAAPLRLDDVESFASILPLTPYLVPNGNGRTMPIALSHEVLKDLNSLRLDNRIRSSLLDSMKNGIVPPIGKKGIKLFKVFDKISFAEVKMVGGTSGEYRIYGCIQNGIVVFYFLGNDISSSSDPQRLKLKALCK